jgi:hypothetical protein
MATSFNGSIEGPGWTGYLPGTAPPPSTTPYTGTLGTAPGSMFASSQPSGTQPLTLDQAIAQGMNFGQWFDQSGSNGPALNTATVGGATPWAQATNVWDQFRQGSANAANTYIAGSPSLQAAGVKPITANAGNYGAGPAGYQLPTPPSAGTPQAPQTWRRVATARPRIRISAGRQTASATARTISPTTCSTRSTLVLSLSVAWVASVKAWHKALRLRRVRITSRATSRTSMGRTGMPTRTGACSSTSEWIRTFYTLNAGWTRSGAAARREPLEPWQHGRMGSVEPSASNIYSPYTGFGQTTQTGQQGGGIGGAVGGVIGAGTFAHNMGWW